MKVDKVDFRKVGVFSKLFLDYLENKDEIKPLISYPPTIPGFGEIIKERKLSHVKRQLLSEVLTKQYSDVPSNPEVDENIKLLENENTFTVTTGHQLNIFTGPLYFIYKIITVIRASERLKKEYPDKNFIPVYWMASEDHDFEEISYFYLFGDKLTWKTDQKGPVGRFDPSSLKSLFKELPDNAALFKKAYSESNSLSSAVRKYAHQLFGNHGLITIDADDRQLKGSLIPVMREDILDQTLIQHTKKSDEYLNAAGYKTQAFSREINFFYLDGDGRERIIRKENKYVINNTDLSFSREELEKEIQEHPERFSPNVITRPIYQELILPNIAYCGGPAEMAYWLQLKSTFDHLKVSFPVLLPRSFGLVVYKSLIKKIQKLHLKAEDLFKDTHDLISDFLDHHSDGSHLMDKETAEMHQFFEKLEEKAARIDKSLEGYVAARAAHMEKELEKVGKRLKKAVEQQNDISISQIESIKEKLFPQGNLQERHDNYLSLEVNDRLLLKKLFDVFDPFDFRFHVMFEE